MSDGQPGTAADTGLRSLLRIRDFRYLWFGQIVSDFGDSLTSLSLLILVQRLTGSTVALAGLAIAITLPVLLFGLLAGVYVDRWDRRRVMIAADLARAVVVLSFVFVRSADQVWILYVIGFVQATIGTLFNPAKGSLLPSIVPERMLLAANSVSQTSRIAFNVLGVAVAGIIAGVAGVVWPAFIVDAVSFALSAVLVSRIAHRHVPADGEHAPVWDELKSGLRIVTGSRGLRGVLLAAAVAMLGLGAIGVLLVPFVVDVLMVPETWFGAIEASQVIGMIVAGIAVAGLASRLRPSSMTGLSLAVIGVGVGGMAFVDAPWKLMVLMAVVGLGVTPAQSAVATLSQTLVARDMLGRAQAALSSVISLATVVSQAAAGVLAATIGIRSVFGLGAVVTFAAAIVAFVMLRDETFAAEEDAAPAAVAS